MEHMEPARSSSVEHQKRLDIRIEAEPSDERRKAILGVLHREDLSPATKLEILAEGMEDQDPETMEDLHAFAAGYGLPFESLTTVEQRQISAMYRAVHEAKQSESRQDLTFAIEATFRNRMVEHAFENVDRLNAYISGSETLEDLEERVTDAVQAMGTLAKHISPEQQQNQGIWVSLMERWNSLLQLKKAGGDEVGRVIENVFRKRQDVIENELIYPEWERLRTMGHPTGVEELTKEMYGRTLEELERIKEENRAKVGEYISEHAEEAPSIELLEQLHQMNNAGIVPRRFSTFRKKLEEVTFGPRAGVIGEDVREEMEDFEARATLATFERMSKAVYELVVAKLHNDFIEIHPFSDRNGSTGMLFMEFMMAKKGYVPDPKRNTNYYSYVRKVLGNNLAAVAIVGHGHWKIANTPGYYEKGKTTKGKEKDYERIIPQPREKPSAKKGK